VALLGGEDGTAAVSLYSALNVLEKACLVAGLVRFFNLPARPRALWGAVLAVEAWVLACWLADLGPLFRGAGVAAFNAGALACAAWIAYAKRAELSTPLMSITAAASALLVLHWASAFLVIH